MRIQLNGTPIETSANTLTALLIEQNLETATVATARNGDFVPTTLRPTTSLSEGDQIEILAPMQGG